MIVSLFLIQSPKFFDLECFDIDVGVMTITLCWLLLLNYVLDAVL